MALELSPTNQNSSYHTAPEGNIAAIQPQADRTRMSKMEEPVRTKTLGHISRTPPTHRRASRHTYSLCNMFTRISHILGMKTFTTRVLFTATISNGIGHELTYSR